MWLEPIGCYANCAGFAAKGDFENMVTYSTAQGYKPDYLYLMQRMMMDNPEAAVSPILFYDTTLPWFDQSAACRAWLPCELCVQRM